MIRPATHEDLPRIVEMGKQFIEDVYPAAITFSPEHLTDLGGKLIDGTGMLSVAEYCGRIIGFVAVIVVTQPMSGETIAVELTWWVDPDMRGGRAAILLFEEAKKWGRSKGATRLQMVAPSDKVCRFYEKIGGVRAEVAYMVTL